MFRDNIFSYKWVIDCEIGLRVLFFCCIIGELNLFEEEEEEEICGVFVYLDFRMLIFFVIDMEF